MEGRKSKGYAWAILAGLNAALAAISAKFFSCQVLVRLSSHNFATVYGKRSSKACLLVACLVLSYYNAQAWSTIISRDSHAAFQGNLYEMVIKYGLVVLFNVIMWGFYVNSLKALSSLQATVTNFATNFLSSGLAGFFLFEEPLSFQWFAGAMFIVIGVFILSKSSIEKESID